MDLPVPVAELESLLAAQHAALIAMLARRIPKNIRGFIAAEDAAQEAALEAVRSLPHFRPEQSDSLRRWVWRIARHRLGDLIKAHRRLKRSGGMADSECAFDRVVATGPCPARAADQSETVATLSSALSTLPDAYRQAIQLRYIDGLPVPDAAARLGRTPGAFQMLCNRGLKLLRQSLESTPALPRPVAA